MGLDMRYKRGNNIDQKFEIEVFARADVPFISGNLLLTMFLLDFACVQMWRIREFMFSLLERGQEICK